MLVRWRPSSRWAGVTRDMTAGTAGAPGHRRARHGEVSVTRCQPTKLNWKNTETIWKLYKTSEVSVRVNERYKSMIYRRGSTLIFMSGRWLISREDKRVAQLVAAKQCATIYQRHLQRFFCHSVIHNRAPTGSAVPQYDVNHAPDQPTSATTDVHN